MYGAYILETKNIQYSTNKCMVHTFLKKRICQRMYGAQFLGPLFTQNDANLLKCNQMNAYA